MSHSVVIGGAGFVGSWVVEEILKKPDAKVTIIDNLISSEKWNITDDPRVKFIRGSASNFESFERIDDKADYVYQLACFHGNQSSLALPLEDLENGLKSTLTTLEWVRKFNKEARVIYTGAGCAVADKTWETPKPISEIDITSLEHDSPYSISKITGEMYCKLYAKQFGLEVIRLRFQNVYGPREILGAGQWRGTINTIWRNVIPTFVYKAIKNQALEIYQSSNASRDFIYVEDVARGVVLASEKGNSGSVYNLATGLETFISNLAHIVVEECQSSSQILIKDKRNWDNSGRRLADTSKSQENLGFKSNVDLREGISRTVKWTLENLNRIDKCISRFDQKKYSL